MTRWSIVPGKLAGFSYFPLWEVGFGWFLMICACALPILFFWYNGVNVKQYLEWLFSLLFLVFFLFMGWKLAFQRFEANASEGRLMISQNLRDPGFSGSWPISDWKGMQEEVWKDENGQSGWKLVLQVGVNRVEVYHSIKQSEITDLIQTFEELKRSMP